MTYRIPLPSSGRADRLDIVDPSSTMIQRQLRRTGLASYEPSTAATLLALFDAANPGFVFYDIGANVALYSALCASMFEPAEVIAFEPAPSTADVAELIVGANGLDVRVERIALSGVSGSAELHLSPISDASHSLTEGFRDSQESVTVVTRRLDDVVAGGQTPPDIIKIDVETHEAAVLSGAIETLRQCRPRIVVEVLPGRAGRDFAAEIAAVVDELGYVYYELNDVPSFQPVDCISASSGGTRDWLLAPEQLTPDFADRWRTWSEQLAACTPDRNSRVPLTSAVKRAWGRGGPLEVLATARRSLKRSAG